MALCFILSAKWGATERIWQRKGDLSAGKQRKDVACTEEHWLVWGKLSVSLPFGYTPTTQRFSPHVGLFAWLVQDPAPPPTSVYPLMPSFTCPHQHPESFLSVVYPEAMDALRTDKGERSKLKDKNWNTDRDYFTQKLGSFSLCSGFSIVNNCMHGMVDFLSLMLTVVMETRCFIQNEGFSFRHKPWLFVKRKK